MVGATSRGGEPTPSDVTEKAFRINVAEKALEGEEEARGHRRRASEVEEGTTDGRIAEVEPSHKGDGRFRISTFLTSMTKM